MANVETVTILISDLVGSTRLETSVGPARADELRTEHFGLLREAIAQSEGGREVKNTGDGMMAAFSSASAAASCAVAMQQRMDRRNRGAVEQLTIRIGIGMGDATHENGDYFGLPSIEAARLCDKAPAGGILIPELVRLMLGRRGNVEISPAGALELKGIPEPVEAYEIGWQPLAAAPETRTPLPARLAGVPPIGYVGRETEVGVLNAICDRAQSGARQVGLLTGEPGIGKTRMATHVALARHADGAAVLYGRCAEDLGTPYGPWIEALGHYVDHAPDQVLAAHVERYGGELTRMLPRLEQRIDGITAPSESDPETERYLLFAAVVGLLAEVTSERPVVLLLDDLHWADKPSLALLKHVVSESASLPLVIIGTYRDSELSREHPLPGVLADLRREQGVQRVSLSGLPEADVATMMEATAGHELDDAGRHLAGEIAAESDGNPFFVAELLRHLVESGVLVEHEGGRLELEGDLTEVGLPQSVREVVGQRVDRLGDASRRVLGIAAVIGRDFDVDLLFEVVDAGEDEVLDLLEAATRASLLVERSDQTGRFSFAHALINHTLYDDLGATRRARVHRRVAEALEDLCGDDTGPRVAELAKHWAAATVPVDVPKAVGYARQAGERARENLAPDEAIRWYQKALALDEQRREKAPQERCDLLIGLAEAQRDAGDPAFARTLLDAAAIARELGDTDRLARAVLAHNRGFTAVGVVDVELAEMAEAALAMIGDDQPSVRSMLLARLCTELAWHPDRPRRRALGDEALALARRSGDDRALAQVLWWIYMSLAEPSTLDQRTGWGAEICELADRIDDPVLQYWAAFIGIALCVEHGDRDGFEHWFHRISELADQLGQPVLRWTMLWLAADRALVSGRLVEAEQLSEEAARLGTTTNQPDAMPVALAQIDQMRWMQDRLAEFEAPVARMLERTPDGAYVRAVMASVYCGTGRPDEARALIDPMAADDFAAIPPDLAWMITTVRCADVAAEIGHVEAARKLYNMLAPFADQLPTAAVSIWLPVAYYLGRLAHVLGRDEDASRHFAFAVERAEGFRAPPFVAMAKLEWGRALLERGDPADAEQARTLIEEAGAVGRELGIARIERRGAESLAPR